MTSKIECVNDEFKCPIFYNEKKVALNDTIVQDLELIALIDSTSDASSSPLLHHAYQPTSLWGKKVVEQLATHYTTDPVFLIDTQTLLMSYESNKDAKHDGRRKRSCSLELNCGGKAEAIYLPPPPASV